jgi:hypothetical protein
MIDLETEQSTFYWTFEVVADYESNRDVWSITRVIGLNGKTTGTTIITA